MCFHLHLPAFHQETLWLTNILLSCQATATKVIIITMRSPLLPHNQALISHYGCHQISLGWSASTLEPQFPTMMLRNICCCLTFAIILHLLSWTPHCIAIPSRVSFLIPMPALLPWDIGTGMRVNTRHRLGFGSWSRLLAILSLAHPMSNIMTGITLMWYLAITGLRAMMNGLMPLMKGGTWQTFRFTSCLIVAQQSQEKGCIKQLASIIAPLLLWWEKDLVTLMISVTFILSPTSYYGSRHRIQLNVKFTYMVNSTPLKPSWEPTMNFRGHQESLDANSHGSFAHSWFGQMEHIWHRLELQNCGWDIFFLGMKQNIVVGSPAVTHAIMLHTLKRYQFNHSSGWTANNFWKLPPEFTDFSWKHTGGKGPKTQFFTHCHRELFHEQLKVLFDDEFVSAWEHGIVILCGDNVLCRFYPPIFTYSADYPEKWVKSFFHWTQQHSNVILLESFWLASVTKACDLVLIALCLKRISGTLAFHLIGGNSKLIQGLMISTDRAKYLAQGELFMKRIIESRVLPWREYWKRNP